MQAAHYEQVNTIPWWVEVKGRRFWVMLHLGMQV